MRLYLMRHGEAFDAPVDQQRPLSEKGRQEVAAVASFLVRTDQEINQIYHSEKLRAEQTAKVVAQKFTTQPKIATLPGLLPDDDVKPLATDCNSWYESTLLVGHLPFMSKLASDLLMQRSLSIQFETAAILCLEAIGHGDWCISWFIRPDLLHV